MWKIFVAIVAAIVLLVLSGCTQAPPVSCTEEAKICPDGTTVGRIGPACEFALCPGEGQVCPKDLKICPDGSKVSRNPDNNCQFFACPNENGSPQWLSYKPIQCENNSWEVWHKSLGRQYIRAPTEEEILREYYAVIEQVQIIGYKSIPAPDGYITCKACSCERGDTIVVSVSQQDRQKMLSNGWEIAAMAQPDPYPTTRQACLSQGGEWNAHCGLISPCCNFATSDAGMQCTDNSECEGTCMAENTQSATGTCSEWKTQFGCYSFFENGLVTGAICVD